MKQLLEVTLAFEVEVEIADDADPVSDAADWNARLGSTSLTLTHGGAERPTRVLFQTERVGVPRGPRPDEFRCDLCRREFSNDEKDITDDGDELCSDCSLRRVAASQGGDALPRI
jgi:hypothetical protein